MHVVLTAAYDPGDLDPGKTYAHVRVKALEMDLAAMALKVYLDWGNWNGSVWSDTGKKCLIHEYTGADLNTIMATPSNEVEVASATMRRAVLEKFIADGILVGTVAAGG